MRKAPPAPTKPRTTTTTMKPNLLEEDRDRAQLERDLGLLSSLLGRKISIDELPILMQQLRGERKSKPSLTPTPSTTIRTTSITTTTTTPRSTTKSTGQTFSNEKILALLKDPALSSGNLANIDLYGKSNEAVLAAILKQRGIVPTHNNVPINVSKVILIF